MKIIAKQVLSVGIFLFANSDSYAQIEGLFSPINDSTVSRYRYEVVGKSYAEIPSGTGIDQIDISERDLLQSQTFHQVICTGINNSYEPFFQILDLKKSSVEDWIKSPDVLLLSPNGSFGFDSMGTQEYFLPHKDAENQDIQAKANSNERDGFRPVLMFFPCHLDIAVQSAVADGAFLTLLTEGAFKLEKPGVSILVEPQAKRIIQIQVLDSVRIENLKEYRLFDPYGYVPTLEIERRTRMDLAKPVTFIRRSVYRNHAMEDIGGLIEKYTDKAHIEVFPNPIKDDYEVLLRGIPDAQISQVQIRDHLGNIIQTQLHPTVNQSIISLDGSSYPDGVLIIIVSTQYGMHTTNLTKL